MAEIPRLWSRRSGRDSDSRSPFRPGDKVDDRYLIDGYIARGGMSVVYRAIDTRLDRPVALKVLRSDLAAREEFRQGFVAEAKTVANLRGPGIVTVSDQGMWKGEAFLVMELVAGGTVRELLNERGPMPPYAAVAVLKPTLEALAVAHRSGFVHRDVKPENILIGPEGTLKVVDFGLVRAVNSDHHEGYLVGTAAYLAPEQVTGEPITPRCDVYSAGLVLYELLVGTAPFGMEATREVAERRLTDTVPSASSQRPGIPVEFDRIIATATARDPEYRYVDAQAMRKALDQLSTTLQLPHYVVPTPRESAEQTAAQTALSTMAALRKDVDDASSGPSTDAETDVLGANNATEVLGSGDATEIFPMTPLAGGASPVQTAVLTSAVPLEDTSGLFPPESEDEESVDDDEPDSAYDEDPADEPLTPEEERAWRLASHPRVWPVLVWVVALVLVLCGVGVGMRSLGHELLPPAPVSHSHTEVGNHENPRDQGNQPEALFP